MMINGYIRPTCWNLALHLPVTTAINIIRWSFHNKYCNAVRDGEGGWSPSGECSSCRTLANEVSASRFSRWTHEDNILINSTHERWMPVHRVQAIHKWLSAHLRTRKYFSILSLPPESQRDRWLICAVSGIALISSFYWPVGEAASRHVNCSNEWVDEMRPSSMFPYM